MHNHLGRSRSSRDLTEMFRARWRFVVYALLSALLLSWPAEAHPPEIGRTSGIQGVGNRSLIFEPNLGQTDPEVKFVSRGAGYTVFLTPGGTVLSFTSPANPKAMLRMKLIGAKHDPLVTGVAELPGKVNYLIGNAPASWRTGIPTYAKVRYGSVYPGAVRLRLRGNDQNQGLE